MGEKSRGIEKGKEEWEKTTSVLLKDSGTVFCLFGITNAHKSSHACHLKINKVQPPSFFMLPIKQKTKTPFAKNDLSQDLFKSKYALVKTIDYMIFCG